MKRVIVDIDPGTDDAYALLLLLCADFKKLIKLEAITCVNGNTKLENVVKNVVRLLELAGRTDIPVYKGAAEPLILPQKPLENYQGADGFGDLNHEKEPDLSRVKKEIASFALGKLVSESPGQISLITLGPLTNIALAIKLFPNFGKCLNELHLMGGNYRAVGNVIRAAEFNFFVDPEAIYIVLESVTCPIFMLTWETIVDSDLILKWRKDVFVPSVKNSVCGLIVRAEDPLYTNRPLDYKWTPCDAYLVASFLHPNEVIKEKSKFHATVELHGGFTRGQVVLDHLKEEDENVTIIQTVHNDVFKKIMLEAAAVENLKNI